jgi:hypothetical protein
MFNKPTLDFYAPFIVYGDSPVKPLDQEYLRLVDRHIRPVFDVRLVDRVKVFSDWYRSEYLDEKKNIMLIRLRDNRNSHFRTKAKRKIFQTRNKKILINYNDEADEKPLSFQQNNFLSALKNQSLQKFKNEITKFKENPKKNITFGNADIQSSRFTQKLQNDELRSLVHRRIEAVFYYRD